MLDEEAACEQDSHEHEAGVSLPEWREQRHDVPTSDQRALERALGATGRPREQRVRQDARAEVREGGREHADRTGRTGIPDEPGKAAQDEERPDPAARHGGPGHESGGSDRPSREQVALGREVEARAVAEPLGEKPDDHDEHGACRR